MRKVLITGVNGQIGSELKDVLTTEFGIDNVVGLDIRQSPDRNGLHEIANVTNSNELAVVVARHQIDTIFHLASLLSARGEDDPDLAWRVNVEGLKNVLDLARSKNLRVFWPSSIAVFGPDTPKDNTPQSTILKPTTMYGITKVAGELLCNYYFEHFSVDVRSVRFPGLISYKTEPGGGTTDYAVAIFYEAVRKHRYTSFVGPDTCLPMMYMPDAIKAMLGLMNADATRLTVRTSYNLTAVSFTVGELASELRKRIPDFECTYEPDFRQEIANSWPHVVDDSRARNDWGWKHDFDLPAIVHDMLEKLSQKPAR